MCALAPKLALISLLYCLVFGVEALDNGLALTPPMGWMQWERFRCLTDCKAYPDECISENLFMAMADRVAEDGYLKAGYEYIMIDDCWMANKRDSGGRLQPNATRFPNGIKALADYIHAKGLKFGIYADYGVLTCAGYPGSLGHLATDATTFAEWGVDYLKFDGCYFDDLHQIGDGYVEMSGHLNATGRPITFSCSWPAYQEPESIKPNYSALAEYCNLWRNWDDVDDSWASVRSILEWFGSNQDRIAPFAGEGHWNDPDMLIIGNYGLSYEQSKAQMAMWAILAAPLIMSVDLRTIEPQFRDILQNKDLIAINQDEYKTQGRLVLKKASISVWTRPIAPKVDGHFSLAIAFLSNRTDGYPYRLGVTLSQLKATGEKYSLLDVFENVELGTFSSSEEFFVRVKPTGVVLLKATPISNRDISHNITKITVSTT